MKAQTDRLDGCYVATNEDDALHYLRTQHGRSKKVEITIKRSTDVSSYSLSKAGGVLFNWMKDNRVMTFYGNAVADRSCEDEGRVMWYYEVSATLHPWESAATCEVEVLR